MAKLVIKSDNITPFGGLYSIFNRFSASGLGETIDSHLGRRSSDPKAFTYGDVFGSLFGRCSPPPKNSGIALNPTG